MLSKNTKSVTHFGKFVPCSEGRVISYQEDPARLVRVESQNQAETIAEQFQADPDSVPDYQLGDNYMLTQHPVTAPIIR